MKRFLVVGLIGFACSGKSEDTRSEASGAAGAGAAESLAGHSAAGERDRGSSGASDGTGADQGDSGNEGTATNGGAGERPDGSGGSDASTGGSSPGGGRAGGQGQSGDVAGGDAFGGDAAGGNDPGQGGRDGCVGDSCSSGPPRVLLLLDSSSSMFEPRETLWDAAYAALMDEDTGAVARYQDRIRFGFAAFRGSSAAVEEDEPACADIPSVPSTLDNYDAIDALYSTLDDAYTEVTKWETPTAHAIRRVVGDFAAQDGRKFLVLITDGHPNTCRILDPQCGQDLSINAVQEARALGITTLALGLGDIVEAPGSCDSQLMRCGTDHLQDLANAGVGLPVEPPPPGYVYTYCVMLGAGTLLASYGASGEGGDARFYSASGPSGLEAELGSMLDSVLAGEVP